MQCVRIKIGFIIEQAVENVDEKRNGTNVADESRETTGNEVTEGEIF